MWIDALVQYPESTVQSNLASFKWDLNQVDMKDPTALARRAGMDTLVKANIYLTNQHHWKYCQVVMIVGSCCVHVGCMFPALLWWLCLKLLVAAKHWDIWRL